MDPGLPSAIPSADSCGSRIVTFRDRHTAEKFFYGSKDIPGVGSGLEFSWVANASGHAASSTFAPNRDVDAEMEGVESDGGGGAGGGVGPAGSRGGGLGGMDYEAAEEEFDVA